MNRAVFLGIELPPVPAAVAGRADVPRGRAAPSKGRELNLRTWWRAAHAGARAGARSVWLADGCNHRAPPETFVPSLDACTLAAAMSANGPGGLIGVVSPLPGGRHPSVLAREVTTLDVVSGGRAAAHLRWDVSPPADPALACEHLADAVAVCAAMLRGLDPWHEGRHVRVSGAVNRPGPRQAGGPPIVVSAPAEVTAELGTGGGRRRGAVVAQVRPMVALADAVVCPADPLAVAAWRTVLEPGQAALLCSVPAIGPAERCGSIAARARDAGADGTILQVPLSTVSQGYGVEGGSLAAPRGVPPSRLEASDAEPTAEPHAERPGEPEGLHALEAVAAAVFGAWAGASG